MIVQSLWEEHERAPTVFSVAFANVSRGGQQAQAYPPDSDSLRAREAEAYWREALSGGNSIGSSGSDSGSEEGGSSRNDVSFDGSSLAGKFRFVQRVLLSGGSDCDVFNHAAYLPILSTLLPVLLLSGTREDAAAYLARLACESMSLAPEHISNIIACCPTLCAMAVEMCVSAVAGGDTDGGSEEGSSSLRDASKRWRALQVLLAVASKSPQLARTVRSLLAAKKTLASVCVEITASHVGHWDVAAWLDEEVMPAARLHECWFFKGLPAGAYRCIADCLIETMADATRGIVRTSSPSLSTSSSSSSSSSSSRGGGGGGALRLQEQRGAPTVDALRINARWLVVVMQLSSQSGLSVSLRNALPVFEAMSEPSSEGAGDAEGVLWAQRVRLVMAMLLSRLLLGNNASSSGDKSDPSPLPYVKASAPVPLEDEAAVFALVAKCVKLLGGASAASGGGGSSTSRAESGELYINTHQPALLLYCMYLSLCCVCSNRGGVRELCVVELGLAHLDLLGEKEREAGAGGAAIRALEKCVRSERSAEKLVATFAALPMPDTITASCEQAGDWLHVLRLLLQFDIFRAAKEAREKAAREEREREREREGRERGRSRANSLCEDDGAIVGGPSSVAPSPTHSAALPSVYSVLNGVMHHVLRTCAWPPPPCLQRVLDLWVAKCTDKKIFSSSSSMSSGGSIAHSSSIGSAFQIDDDGLPLMPPLPSLVEQAMQSLVLYSPDALGWGGGGIAAAGRVRVCFCGSPSARLHVTGMAEEWARTEAAASAAASPSALAGASPRTSSHKKYSPARLALVCPFRLQLQEGRYCCPCSEGESASATAAAGDVNALFSGAVACYASMRYALSAADVQGLYPAPFAASYRELPVRRALELLLALKADAATFALLERMLEMCSRLVPEAALGVCRDAVGPRPMALPELSGGGDALAVGAEASRMDLMRRFLASDAVLHVPAAAARGGSSTGANRGSSIAMPSLPTSELRELFVEIFRPFFLAAYWAKEGSKTAKVTAQAQGPLSYMDVVAEEPGQQESAAATARLWCAWLHLHAAASVPQALELFAINWLFSLQAEQGSRLGCSQRLHFTSYAVMAQEPIALLRLTSTLLHVPLALKIVCFVIRGLLPASRTGAVLALRTKKAAAVSAWAAAGKGSSAPGSAPTVASIINPSNTPSAGHMGRSVHDASLFVDEAVFLDLQAVILSRMLVEVWLDYVRHASAQSDHRDCAGHGVSIRESVLDLLEGLVGGEADADAAGTGGTAGVGVAGVGPGPPAPPAIMASLLHFGVTEGAARLLCLRPALSDALGRGVYAAVHGVNSRASLDPSVVALTSTGLVSLLSHCHLFLLHHHPGPVSSSLAKRLAIALPRFIFATIHCLTRFHPQSSITAVANAVRGIFVLLRDRHPVAAMRLVDAAVLSGVQRTERVKVMREDRGGRDAGVGRIEQEVVGVQRLRESILELARDCEFQGWGRGKDAKELKRDKAGAGVDGRSQRNVLASQMLAASGLCGQLQGPVLGGSGQVPPESEKGSPDPKRFKALN